MRLMDPGHGGPLIDCFRRGEVARDIRLQAAQGVVALPALERVALLVLLTDDQDPDPGRSQRYHCELPESALRSFLARADVPGEIRQFFGDRSIPPAAEADRQPDLESLLESEASRKNCLTNKTRRLPTCRSSTA